MSVTQDWSSEDSSSELHPNIGQLPNKAKLVSAKRRYAELNCCKRKKKKKKIVDVENGHAPPLTDQDLDVVIPFLIKLCRALHSYGAPAHRVEFNMDQCCHRFNIQGNFAVLPTLIIITFGNPETRASETHVLRVAPGLNVAKLDEVDELCDQVACGAVTLADAIRELDKIRMKPPVVNKAIWLLSFAVCSAAIGPVFFNCGWLDVLITFAISIILGGLCFVGDKFTGFGRILEFVCSVVASFCARAAYSITPVCTKGIIFSSILYLLPGFSITIAVSELATRNMVSGTSKLFSAFLTAVELGLGIVIGTKLAAWVPDDIEDLCPAFDVWWYFYFYPISAATLNILLGGSYRQWPVMLASSILAFLVSYFAGLYFPAEAASVLASFAVVLFGNLYSKFTGKPSIPAVISGVIILVPGGIGVRGVTNILSDNIVQGIGFSFQMITIALSITVGMFIGNSIVFPTKTLIFKQY